MDSFLLIVLFHFLFISVFQLIESFPGNSQTLQCAPGNPSIQVPFLPKSQQLQHQSHPNFELFCRENHTVIHFPSYGDLVVKSIFYDTRRMNLVDPKNCVHEVFLNLDLSSTPFHYFYALKNYTYINCSAPLAPSFAEIPCLSVSRYHVYTVEASLSIPASCGEVKTVAIPFSYNPYISDNSFGLALVWDLPECYECAAKNAWSRFKPNKPDPVTKYYFLKPNTALGFGISSVIIIILIVIKLWRHEKLQQKEEEDSSEVVKLLGDHAKPRDKIVVVLQE